MKELIIRDSKGVIRYVRLSITKEDQSYTINRFSGVLGGKEVIQPPLIINKGKAKRTLKEQLFLEANSLVTKYKAKGYKELTDFTNKELKDLNQQEISELFPKENTDENGNLKVMLAKQSDGLKPEIWNRHWFASTKLDGKYI